MDKLLLKKYPNQTYSKVTFKLVSNIRDGHSIKANILVAFLCWKDDCISTIVGQNLQR